MLAPDGRHSTAGELAVFAVEGVVGLGEVFCGGVRMALGDQCHFGEGLESQADVMTWGTTSGDRIVEGDQEPLL